MNISIPIAILFLNTTILVAFTSILSAAYNDERIFPFSRKVSAVSVIFLFSKIVTVAAPFVNEMDEPIPILVMVCLSLGALLITFMYKTKEELDKMQKIGGNL